MVEKGPENAPGLHLFSYLVTSRKSCEHLVWGGPSCQRRRGRWPCCRAGRRSRRRTRRRAASWTHCASPSKSAVVKANRQDWKHCMGWVTIIPRIREDMEMSTPSRPPWIPKKYLDQSEREKGALWLLESISRYFLGFKRVVFFLHFFPQSRHPNRQIISYWYLNCHRKSLL